MILGSIGLVFLGTVLGLLGAGGSILALPLFVYAYHLPVYEASSYSLFAVGGAALLGASRKYFQGHVNLKEGLLFGLPSLTVAFLTRAYLLPKIPEQPLLYLGMSFQRDFLLLMFFALLLFYSSMLMIRGGAKPKAMSNTGSNTARLFESIVFGSGVGFAAGLVGVGGGFMIVPALVLLRGLNMKVAAGTSLFVIFLQSSAAVLGDISADAPVVVSNVLSYLGLTSAGILIGISLSNKVPTELLRKGFGWFLLVMAVAITGKELFG